jgi:hypothetical protein
MNDIAKGRRNKKHPAPRTSSRPSREPKRLILHTGAPKTGSSALQDFLHFNSEFLKQKGVYYLRVPGASSGQLRCLGNGDRLLRWCVEGIQTCDPSQSDFPELEDHLASGFAPHQEDDADNIISNYFTGLNTAICSHEGFFDLPFEGWQRLNRYLKENSIAPRVVVFLRDVYSTYLSHYNHMVRAGREAREFIDFVTDTRAWRMGPLRNFLSILNRKDVCLIHYDSNRDNLAERLLECSGLRIPAEQFEHPLRTVNRGLTDHELGLLLKVNRLVGGDYAMSAGDCLVAARPEISESFVIDERVVQLLSARHDTEVEWVNSIFFAGQSIFSIAGASSPSGAQPRSRPCSGDAPEEKLFEWAIQQLAQKDTRVQADLETTLTRAIGKALLRAATSQYANSPELPPDFNVCGYLLRNIDILFGETEPYEHFVHFGRSEKRTWKLGDTVVIRTPGPIPEWRH